MTKLSGGVGLEPLEAVVLSTFVKHGVRFMVIGGTALALHGHAYRPRNDLDLAVDPSSENQELRSLAATELRAEFGNLARHGPTIDLIGGLHGVNINAALAAALILPSEAGPVPVISLPHFIANKRFMWRTKDVVDLANLTTCPIEGQQCTRCGARVRPHPHMTGWLPLDVELQCEDDVRPTDDLAIRWIT